MTALPADGPATRLPPRIALLSVLGFWSFYFVVATLRSLALGFDDQLEMMALRALVCLGSAAATVLLWLVLRQIGGRTLGRRIAIAAILAVPAAVLYSSINWAVFREANAKHRAAEAAAKKASGVKTIVIDPRGKTIRLPQVPRPPSRTEPERIVLPDGSTLELPIPPDPPLPPTEIRVPNVTVQVGSPSRHDDDDDMTPLQAIGDQALNGYFFFVAWAALYLALCYAAEVAAAERRAAGFRAAAQAAELRALRYQVNPHFLFNTLNALSSLILADRKDQAERMVLNLATFFRTSLTAEPTEDMPLAEEIRLQRLYLDIEAVRFPDRLKVETDIPEALAAACVPGLILQPLVENAVKYGVSRARRPVTIRIFARATGPGLMLGVTDDGEALPAAGEQAGTGVGLRNVADRLQARFGEAARVEWGARAEGGFAVTMTMPLVRNDC